MDEVFYGTQGINARLFHALYQFHGPLLDAVWRILSYAYGYWMAVLAAAVIMVFYLKDRHAGISRHADTRAEMMAVLILAFSLLWCVVYTMQTVTLWPRPWMIFSDTVLQPATLMWHEGFPASAPAIAMMLTVLCWPYSGRVIRLVSAIYVASGSVLSVVSGQSWPGDVLVGLVVGYVAVRLARYYYQFAVRLVSC